MDELIHSLAISLNLIKGFTFLHKPCFTTTLNPHLATHVPNNQTYFREQEKTVTYWARAVSLAEKYILAGAEKRHLCPACQEDRPAGTHCSIPLHVQVYFAVPLIVLPKHLISIASLTLPVALWDVFKVIKIGKYKHPHDTNLATWIGEELLFLVGQLLPAHSINWCKLYILWYISVRRDPDTHF